jgi:hypothetical protein
MSNFLGKLALGFMKAIGTFAIISIVGAVILSMGKPHAKIIELQGESWACTKTHIEHHEGAVIGNVHQPSFDVEECDAYKRTTSEG